MPRVPCSARPARCGTRSAEAAKTQALIYHPELKMVIGINALGVAPSGATVEYYRSQGYN
jgi:hypothetical protein